MASDGPGSRWPYNCWTVRDTPLLPAQLPAINVQAERIGAKRITVLHADRNPDGGVIAEYLQQALLLPVFHCELPPDQREIDRTFDTAVRRAVVIARQLNAAPWGGAYLDAMDRFDWFRYLRPGDAVVLLPAIVRALTANSSTFWWQSSAITNGMGRLMHAAGCYDWYRRAEGTGPESWHESLVGAFRSAEFGLKQGAPHGVLGWLRDANDGSGEQPPIEMLWRLAPTIATEAGWTWDVQATVNQIENWPEERCAIYRESGQAQS